MKSPIRATVLPLVAILTATLTGCVQNPLTVEQKKGVPPLVTYTPKIAEKLSLGEHMALYLFLSHPTVTLDAAIASSGGDHIDYAGPVEGARVDFAATLNAKEARLLGYKFRVFDIGDKFFSDGKAIRIRLFGPSAAPSGKYDSDINWSILRPKARVSAALGVFKEEAGDYRFLRVATPVSNIDFDLKE